MTTLMLALKLTIVFSIAGLATAALREGRAAARHLVWGLALAGALALPFLSGISPRMELAVLPADLMVANAATQNSTFAAAVSDGSAVPAVTANAATGDADAAQPGPASAVEAPRLEAGRAGLDASLATGLPWLLVAWASGSALFALLVLASIVATTRLARRGTRSASDQLAHELNACRAALGITRPVRLLVSDEQLMPMTWGAWRPTVLLPAAALEWSAERRRDVLLHELAHVRRYDWLSQIGARLVCAAYWWHPLAWYAAKRMREERELACDDLVIVQGTNPAEYAHHLLAIAKDLRASPATALAGVAMARPSQLASRLLAALDATRRRSGVSRAYAGIAATAAATLVLPIAGLTAVAADAHTVDVPTQIEASTPTAAVGLDARSPRRTMDAFAPILNGAIPGTVAAPVAANTLCRWDADGERSTSHSNINDDRVTIRMEFNDCEMSLRSRGLVRFSDNERDVEELGIEAWFEIEERGRGSERRRAEFERRDGGIVRRYYVNGREATFDAAAQEWFGSAMLVVFRRTSFQARERVIRIHARGGTQAVLAEVNQMYSSSALSSYLRYLAERERLSSAQVRQIANLAGERITSSSSLAAVLIAMLENPGLDEDAQAAVIAATTKINSSSNRSKVLVTAVESRPLSPRLADGVLRSASEISSASSRSEVLLAVGAKLPSNATLPASYIEAAKGISSSSALGRVLVALVQRDRLSDASLSSVLEVAGQISSSSEKTKVLEAVLEKHRLSDRTRSDYFNVVDGINSSSNKGVVLRSVLGAEPDAATTTRVFTAVETISSSSEKAETLVTAARKGLVSSAALRTAYEHSAATITSRSERERALQALGDRRL